MTSKKKSSKEKDERTCAYKTHDGKPCEWALYDGEYCIFHSKDIEGKKDKFDKKFWKEFERQKEYEEIYDFEGFAFPGDISFKNKKFEKNVCFLEATFSGMADFSEAKFSGMANFNATEFLGPTKFFKTIFSSAHFLSTNFFKFASFREAVFHNGSAFGGAKFFEDAYFTKAKFKSGGFGNTEFSKNVSFSEAEFSESIQLFSAKFYRNAYFEKAHFSGFAHFNEVKFFGHVEFGNIDFFKVKNCSFKNTYFFSVGGLSQFIEKYKEKFKPSINPRLEILSEDFRLILGEVATARYPVISRQIRDDMYLLDKKERISKMPKIRKCCNRILYFLWWLFADYGRSFFRWAFFSFLFICIFTGIFCWIGLEKFSIDVMLPKNIFTMFYYSVVTFTTLGFGDVTPHTAGACIAVIFEVITGYIMLGGLISIFANKLARRS